MGGRGLSQICRACSIGVFMLVAATAASFSAGAVKASAAKGDKHASRKTYSPRELHALALMHFNGTMVTRDEKEAARLMMQAAERGHVPSMYYVGVFYHGGMGVARDHQLAALWLRKAAERGYADAQYALGLVLLSGDGVSADREEAIEWLGKAAAQGDSLASAFLRQLVAYRGPGSDVVAELKALPPPEVRGVNGKEPSPQKRGLMLDQGSFSLKFSLPEVDRNRPFKPGADEERLLDRLQGGKVELIVPIGRGGNRDKKGEE